MLSLGNPPILIAYRAGSSLPVCLAEKHVRKKMQKTPHGLYRTQGMGGLSNSVRVTDGTIAFDMEEGHYRDKGYEPDFDVLPWKPEYDAAQAEKDEEA